MVEVGVQCHVLAGLSSVVGHTNQCLRPFVGWVYEPLRRNRESFAGEAKSSYVWYAYKPVADLLESIGREVEGITSRNYNIMESLLAGDIVEGAVQRCSIELEMFLCGGN